MILVNKTLGFWARKLLHLSMNGTIAIAALLVQPAVLKPLSVVGFIILLIFESLRLKTRARQYVDDAVGPLFKQEEAVEYSGMFWIGVGALIVALFADPVAYSYGFAVLAIADTAAAMVGKHWPVKRYYRNKTVSGALACFTATALVTAAYIYYVPLPFPLIPSMVFMGGIITVLETFSHPFDDNFLILVVSSFLMSLALSLS
jgi:dolichol kinase